MKPAVTWTIKILALIILVALTVYGWGFVTEARRDVLNKQRILEQGPQRELYLTALEAELAKHKVDIGRIKATLVTREGLGQFVTLVEEEARRQSVEVSVPQIQEKKRTDDQGKEVSSTGPIQEVSLEIVANGSPAGLTAFLHAVEHFPYLLYIEEWSIQQQTTTSARGTTAQALPDTASSAPSPAGSLRAVVVVSVIQDSVPAGFEQSNP